MSLLTPHLAGARARVRGVIGQPAPVPPPAAALPEELPNLLLYLDPLRSPVSASGTVEAIDDLGPGEKTYSQATGAFRPTLTQSGIQGGPSLQGTGGHNLWRNEAVIWGGPTAPRSIYLLVRGQAQQDRQALAEARVASNNPRFQFGSGETNTAKGRLLIRDDSGAVRVEVSTTTDVFDNGPHRVRITWNAQGQGVIHVDGAADVNFTIPGDTALTLDRSSVLAIQRDDDPTFPFNGHLGPVLVFGEVQAADKVAVVEGYLAAYPEQAEPVVVPAAAPVMLAPTVTHHSASWSWQALADATGYEVEHGPVGGPHVPVDVGSSFSYTAGGLDPETAYEARARGRNSAGNGPFSSFVPATTTAEPVAPPAGINITGISFDTGSVKTLAPGSDNWPVTWSDDDHQYTSWGDGGGFGGTDQDGRVSLGFGRLEGTKDSYTGHNIWGGKDAPNAATFGGKCRGIISVAGVLYAWRAGTASENGSMAQTQLLRSTNKAASWSQMFTWTFNISGGGFFDPTFLQFGKDYADARDDYVYAYAPENKNGVWEVQKPGEMTLMRCPQGELVTQGSWQWFTGLSNGTATWTSTMSARQSVFSHADGFMRTSAIYNPWLKRYLIVTQQVSRLRSNDGHIGIYQAPEPWGPWSPVLFVNPWNYGLMTGPTKTVFWNFSSKWWHDDGKKFVFVGTLPGDDQFGTIEGAFTVEEEGEPPPPPPPEDPLSLPGVILALDPERSAVTISGGKVFQIDDIGPGGKHFSQDDANARLTLEAAGIQNGPALRGQSDGFLRRAEAICWPRTNFALYFLVRGVAQNNNRIYSEGNASDDNPHWELDSDAAGKMRLRAQNNSGVRFADAITNATVFDNQPRIVCISKSGSTGQIHVDGVADVTFPTTGTISLNQTALMARLRSTVSSLFNGRLGPVYAFSNARSSEQAAVVEGYLAAYPEEPEEPTDPDEPPPPPPPPEGGALPVGVFTHGDSISVSGFQTLTGKTTTLWMTSLPWNNWDGPRMPTWKVGPMKSSMAANPNVRVVLMYPMISTVEGFGGAALQKGADGQYNQHYAAMAQRLRDNGIDNIIFRAGWEASGGWYPWGFNNNATNADRFRQMWIHFVTTVRATYPGNRFVFEMDLHQDVTTASLNNCWPGGQYVDVLSMSSYDEWWGQPPVQTDVNLRWAVTLQKLERLRTFAASKGKPLAFAEWGVWSGGSDSRGGGDNAHYIEQKLKYMQNPDNNVHFHVYFNVNATGDHRFQVHPQALQAFKDHCIAAPTPLVGVLAGL